MSAFSESLSVDSELLDILRVRPSALERLDRAIIHGLNVSENEAVILTGNSLVWFSIVPASNCWGSFFCWS